MTTTTASKKFNELEIGTRFGWFKTHDDLGDLYPDGPKFHGPYVKTSKAKYQREDGSIVVVLGANRRREVVVLD